MSKHSGEVEQAICYAEQLLIDAPTHEREVDRFDVRIPGSKTRRYTETVRRRIAGLPAGQILVHEVTVFAQRGQPPTLKVEQFQVSVPGSDQMVLFDRSSDELPDGQVLDMLQLAHANISVIHQDQQNRTS